MAAAASGVNINCPTLGSFSTSGSATMKVLNPYVVSLGEPAATFEVDGDAFAHFSVAQEAAGSADPVITCSIKNVANLKTALKGWLATATQGSQTVQQWLNSTLTSEINGKIGSDGVAAAYQGSSIGSSLTFSGYTAAADGGAEALVTALNDSQEARDRIALQFSNDRYGTTSTTVSELPAQADDTMTFQFTITSAITVSDEAVDDADAGGNGTAPATSGLDLTGSVNVIHIVVKKTA